MADDPLEDLTGSPKVALSQDEFERVRRMLHAFTGISLGAQKINMVQGRLGGRIVELGLQSATPYLKRVEVDVNERQTFMELLTTNVTSFFREAAHFVDLANTLIPDRREVNEATRSLRIWSTACSTGEEVWSIAMVVAEAMAAYPSWSVEILATDINHTVLATAEAGVYPMAAMEQIAPERRSRWFQRGTGRNHGYARIKDGLRGFVKFMPINLVGDWPRMQPFDIIFCRNVAIYFDQETRAKLNNRLLDHLNLGGYLLSGHSEALVQTGRRARWLGNTIYQKVE